MKRSGYVLILAVLLSLLALFASLAGCASPTTTTPAATAAAVKNVTPTQANDLINANKTNTKFVILDVRTPAEYAEGHIQYAVLIDYNSPTFGDEVGKLDKSKTYLVYCRSGNRSASASKVMVDTGFKDVYNMTGGITEWQSAVLPLVK
jgi:rhodanese-related sulfurtransferase